MNIADLKDYWQLVTSIAVVLLGCLGFLWRATWKITNAMNSLKSHEDKLTEYKTEFGRLDQKVRRITYYLNQLTENLKKYIDPGDRVNMTTRLLEIVETSLISTNPVTPEDREKFERYRQKAMFGHPFTADEYEDFKLLGEKFKYELFPDKQAEFETIMTGLLSSLLTASIRKFESESRIAGKDMEVKELYWETPMSGYLQRPNGTQFFVLKDVKAHGEIVISLAITQVSGIELVAAFEVLPTLYDWEYRAQGEGHDKLMRIFPTKPGNYYLLAEAEIAGGDYTITAREVGYYCLKTASFFRPEKQEEYRRKAKTTSPIYNIHAIVDADTTNSLERVERVEYVLPGSWPAELRTQIRSDKNDKFRFKELAYGSFVLTAKVYLRDWEQPLELQDLVKLQKASAPGI